MDPRAKRNVESAGGRRLSTPVRAPDLAAERPEDAAQDDDGDDAQPAIDERDGRGRLLWNAVQEEDADDAGLDEAESGRRERNGGQQGGRQRDEDRGADAEPHLRQGERANDEVEAGALQHPDRGREGQDDRNAAHPERSRASLLEALPEQADASRQQPA